MGYPATPAFGAGASAQQIWLDNLSCAGTEATLGACSHSAWGSHNCYHAEDAGVACFDKPSFGELAAAPSSAGTRMPACLSLALLTACCHAQHAAS